MSTAGRIVMLSVGVGRYQSPQINSLALPPADALAMSQVFCGQAGAQPVVKLLLNEEATKAGIRAGVDWLAEQVGPDDIAIWYYSGHGARYADPDSEEPNAYDEYLCPYDALIREGDASTLVRDKEIKAWLRKITARTPNLVAIFDSCHSGDAVQLGEATPREIERNIVHAKLDGIELEPAPVEVVSSKRPLDGHMLLAAAQPHQRAYEFRSMQNGLFTTYVLKALGDGGVRTFYELFRAAADEVILAAARARLQQTPQLMQRVQGDLAFR